VDDDDIHQLAKAAVIDLRAMQTAIDEEGKTEV
jgi:hypothetical protein